jgi:hypothetical protein
LFQPDKLTCEYICGDPHFWISIDRCWFAGGGMDASCCC